MNPTYAAAATLCLGTRDTVVRTKAANSRLLCSSNAASDGVSSLGAGKVPSF